MKLPFAKGQQVRFKESFLEGANDAERRRFTGRIGVVTSYRMGSTYPIVDFPRHGRYPAVRCIDAFSERLEAVNHPVE